MRNLRLLRLDLVHGDDPSEDYAQSGNSHGLLSCGMSSAADCHRVREDQIANTCQNVSLELRRSFLT
jgi:hypothetical protein